MKSTANDVVFVLRCGGSAGVRPATLPAPTKGQEGGARVFERGPTRPDGKMDALNARFRDITCKYFAQHGHNGHRFWNPTDPKGSQTKRSSVGPPA